MQSTLKIQDIVGILNKKNVFPINQQLIDKGVISLQEEVLDGYKPKLVRYIRLHEQYTTDGGLSTLLEVLKNAAKQKELVLNYFQLNASEQKPIIFQ